MKKVLVALGLTVGTIVNAQMAFVSAGSSVFKVTRLNFDSVEVKRLQKGEIQSVDTMLFSDFTTLTGGFEIIAGNLKNPIPVAPKIDEHKHEHKPILTQEQKFTAIVYGGTALLTYAIYKLIMWSGNTSSHTNTSGYNGSSYGGQCSATAASTGQRCKRSREPGSAYCWQHQ